MPSIIMDTSGSHGMGSGGGDEMSNGDVQPSAQGLNKGNNATQMTQASQAHMSNGPVMPNGVLTGNGDLGFYGNGTSPGADESDAMQVDALVNSTGQWPPEIPRVPAEGFYPLATIVSRAAQRCSFELNDLIEELHKIDVPQHNSVSNSTQGHGYLNGATQGNQTPENQRKKTRVLDFAQDKRQQFIKLLVISNWSRGAQDVRKAIDIKVWLDNQLQLFAKAIEDVGQMKRRLAIEKMPPPDLDTAIEVLSTGKVARLPDLGLLPRKPLGVRKTLKILRKINVLLSIKINLLDKEDFPDSFLKYKIHDGRVTFTAPTEFELDLSIADEDRSSQFFFVDLRFLFSPSSPIPEGRLRESIEWKTNEILRTGGLPGCFSFLHAMVLTTKVEHFGNLASVMARGSWTEALRIDLHHRTLIVQYWTSRLGPKSWLEIGIKSGRQKVPSRTMRASGISFVHIRWLREKQDIDNAKIKFDPENINFESTLRSVTALHISHILKSWYEKLMEGGMYHEGKMSIKLTTSRREPLDCELEIQLTKTKLVKVTIEPVSGRVILQPPSPLYSGFERYLNASRDLVKDGGPCLRRLRCRAVKEEVEYRARTIGWDVLQNVNLPDADTKRFLPKDAVMFSLLRQPAWRQGWHLLSTHGPSSDLWWIVQINSRDAPAGSVATDPAATGPGLQSAESIDTKYIDPPSAKLTFAYFKKLSFIASGLICLRANTLGLVKHKVTYEAKASPFSSDLPYLLLKFDARKLPSLLPKVKVPSGLWCVEAIRFSYQGLDPLTKSAKLLAQGHLTRSFDFDTLVKLNSNSETLVSYNPKNRAFAFHFNDSPGIPVALSLLSRLRRFERLLRMLTAFARFKLAPDHITLDKAVFSYATDLRACIDFDCEEHDGSHKSAAKVTTASTLPPRIYRKPIIKIHFGRGNPHLRIQHHLITILNEGGGLEEAAFLLKATLPAIQGLDEVQLSHHRGQGAPPALQTSPLKAIPEPIVLYRAADWYGLNYSLPPTVTGPISESRQPAQAGSQSQSLCNFDLRLRSRRDGIQWELTSSNNRQEVELLEETGLAAKLREEIFTARGPGWRGMEKGVVCDKEDVGAGPEAGLSDSGVGLGDESGVRDLLRTVDRVVREVVAAMKPAAQENGGQEGRNESGNGARTKTGKQGGEDDDVIMID